MPNNRKPKLAPGSRWDRDMVMQSIAPNHPDRIAVEPAERLMMVFIDDDPEDSGPNAIANTDDALAAIRAAKLDPVFDTELELVAQIGKWLDVNWNTDGARSLIASIGPQLDAARAAVKGATSDD